MSEPYLGQIRMFAGTFAPVGHAFCDGQLLSIAQNSALFALVGTTFGGDGQSTFGLPDLRGRVPVHVGTGPGLPAVTWGEKAGAEVVSLTPANLPAHSHTMQASDDPAGETNPAGNVTGADTAIDAYHTAPAPTAAMAASGVEATGGGASHNNMMPFLSIRYIISMVGVFPSQN